MYGKQTKLLGLPQWEPEDHPDFLTDMNQAYQKIDNRFQELDGLTATAFSKLEDRVTNAEGEIDVIHDEVDGIVQRVIKNESDIADINNHLADVDSSLTKLDSELKQEVQERSAKDAQQDIEIDALEARVDTLEETNNVYNDKFQEIEGNITIIDGVLTNHHEAIVNVQGDINRLRDTVDAHSDQINTTNANIDELEGRVQNLETTTTGLNERIDALESQEDGDDGNIVFEYFNTRDGVGYGWTLPGYNPGNTQYQDAQYIIIFANGVDNRTAPPIILPIGLLNTGDHYYSRIFWDRSANRWVDVKYKVTIDKSAETFDVNIDSVYWGQTAPSTSLTSSNYGTMANSSVFLARIKKG